MPGEPGCRHEMGGTKITSMSIGAAMKTTRAKPVSHVDKVFRAFADRTRLRILHLLQDGELCVTDVVTILKIPQAKASHHLSYLRRAGVPGLAVDRERAAKIKASGGCCQK